MLRHAFSMTMRLRATSARLIPVALLTAPQL
jgi:hypothetical protein